MSTWVVAPTTVSFPVAEVPPGEVRVVEVEAHRVAVFNADGKFYAVDNRCTHQDAELSDGFLEGCLVECPLHASMFDLRTGEPSGPPANRPVRTHSTVVVDGTVHVTVSVPHDATT